jgi:hypothetical protein
VKHVNVKLCLSLVNKTRRHEDLEDTQKPDINKDAEIFCKWFSRIKVDEAV